MATEIKKLITVDTGGATKTLKDYKKQLEELKGKMVELDTASQEYNDTAKEAADLQDKLNQVVKDSKSTVDAADGSYNALQKTMTELKKAWKATTDEVERQQLGKEISDINDKLKELDASVGDFHRSVGDYANAFEEAFKNSLDGIKSIPGPLGNVADMTKKFIPMIKQINSVALTGLSGIKKAIIGTGIGALVVLVGQLIANWEGFLKLFGASEGTINKIKNGFSDIIYYAKEVGKVIINVILLPFKQVYQQIEFIGNILKDVFTLRFDKIAGHFMDRLKKMKQVIKDTFTITPKVEEPDFSKVQTKYENTLKAIEKEEKKKHLEILKNYKDEDARAKALAENEIKYLKKRRNANAQYWNEARDFRTKDGKHLENLGELQDALNDKITEQDIKLAELQNKQLKVESKQKDITSATRETKEVVDEWANSYKRQLDQMEVYYSQAKLRAKELSTTEEEERLRLLKVERDYINGQISNLASYIEKYKDDQEKVLKAQKEMNDLLSRQIDIERDITKEEENQVKAIRDKKIAAIDEEIKKTKELADTRKEDVQMSDPEVGKVNGEWPEVTAAKAKDAQIYEIEQNQLNRQIELLQQKQALYQNDADMQAQIGNEIQALQTKLANNSIKRDKQVAEEKKRLENDKKNMAIQCAFAAADGIAQSLGAISDLFADDFEKQKKFKIAQTVINTITGAAGAMLQGLSSYPMPFGAIMGGIGAATATATGIAQIIKLKKSKPGDESVDGSGMDAGNQVSAVGVNPLLNEYQDTLGMQSLNINGDSQYKQEPLKVYVTEQDITDTQNKVEVRQNNSSF